MPAAPVGIIESLTSGFEIAAAHIQIMLLPLGIDLFLWLGPRVSLRSVFSGIEHQFYTALTPSMEGDAKTSLLQSIKWFHDLAQAAPERHLPILFPPTLLGGRRVSVLPFEFTPLVIETLPGTLSGIALALFSSLVLYEVYFCWIAQYVVDEPLSPRRFVRRFLSVFLQTSLSIGVIIIVGAVLSVAFLSVLSILQLIGSQALFGALGFLLFVFVFVFIIPACIMVVFTLHSMLLYGRNIIGALWDSVRVAQWNMLPTTIFMILVIGIYVAMNTIWGWADRGSWLALAAMGGNAFIATGLLAATFVFYKDRYRYWREVREALLAEIERRRAQQDTNRQA